jgi:uncharacterized membrane protein
MNFRVWNVAWWGSALLSSVIAVASYRYLLGIGPIPPNVAENRLLNPWIVIHATASATALLIGSFQLLARVRRSWPWAHRWSGRVYVIACVIGGVSALVLSAGISSGPIAGAGFGTLAILWVTATMVGWRAARKGRWIDHRRWMVRSFALTFAAVTLRLYLPFAVIGATLGFSFQIAYQAIAWLCWVPNALLAEWYLGRTKPTGVE